MQWNVPVVTVLVCSLAAGCRSVPTEGLPDNVDAEADTTITTDLATDFATDFATDLATNTATNPICVAPKILCADICVDPSSDNDHCGGCSNACPANTSCSVSQCKCVQGYGNCDGDLADGCETILANNTRHCGKCGNRCPAKQSCVSGKCHCDAKVVGSCPTDAYCNTALDVCEDCDNKTLNCDRKGPCECDGACSGTECVKTCTFGQPNQCDSVYFACTLAGVCVPCEAGLKNCDQQGDCLTPATDPCP